MPADRDSLPSSRITRARQEPSRTGGRPAGASAWQRAADQSPQVAAIQRFQQAASRSPGSLTAAALQRQVDAIQRQDPLEEEPEQLKTAGTVQREELEEEPQQMKASNTVQREASNSADGSGAAGNGLALPGGLRAGMEELSGHDLSGVRVHYDSPEPAQVNALAFARGHDIHLAPRQEQHLAHEAYHIVQQQEGRVPVTGEVGGQALNDDPSLEREADVMGEKAQNMSVQRRTTER